MTAREPGLWVYCVRCGRRSRHAVWDASRSWFEKSVNGDRALSISYRCVTSFPEVTFAWEIVCPEHGELGPIEKFTNALESYRVDHEFPLLGAPPRAFTIRLAPIA